MRNRSGPRWGASTGATSLPPRGYEGPGEGVGDRVVPASFCSAGEGCPGRAFEDPRTARAAADAWTRFLRATLPRQSRSSTSGTSPSPPTTRASARNRRVARPGGALPTFTTSARVPALDGAVDVWSAQAGVFDRACAAAERARGRGHGFETATPPTGAIIIDAPATDPRTIGWAAFKGGADQWLCWHSDHWRHNAQKVGDRIQDVWKNTVTFDNRGQPGREPYNTGFINGDGVLFYPGEEVLHPEEDRGIAGPVSTVQLANLRRGLQDHLYLSMAQARASIARSRPPSPRWSRPCSPTCARRWASPSTATTTSGSATPSGAQSRRRDDWPRGCPRSLARVG